MQFVNYFFASLISFSGLFIGIFLVKIAPEEKKPLREKIFHARKIFLFLAFIFPIFYYYANMQFMLLLIGSLILSFFAEYKINNMHVSSMIIYSVIGILFFLISRDINLFAIESSIILLYGIPTAFLMYKPKGKNLFKIFSYNIPFIIIANLLYILI